MLGWVGLYGFYLLVVWPLTYLCPGITKNTAKLKDFLFWAGTSKFFVESYVQITLMTLLHIKDYEWDTDFSVITLSSVLTICFMAMILILPIALVSYLACNMSKWFDEKFLGKHGALLDNADLDRESEQWIVLLIPVAYFLRRLLMCVTLVFWTDFIWGQLAI